MKIHLISRVRNESDIIEDSINHWKSFVTGKIAIYDDCSTDDTLAIIMGHKDIIWIPGTEHHADRDFANYWCREQALKVIRQVSSPGDWVVCADADERIQFDWSLLRRISKNCNVVAVRLFDYYITPQDKDGDWKSRKWIGPEYRDIVMIWRNDPGIKFDKPSQRVPSFPYNMHVHSSGYCHHYGKARSITHWEEKCKYYQGVFSAQPDMQRKWKFREGKTVKHDMKSDFGNPLILWGEKEDKGIKLTKEIHQQEFNQKAI